NRIRKRASENGEGIELRRHMNFDLSFDHRVTDGADAARFLDTLARTLEDAESLIPD
ncbi:MAG: 2-oxo acid dehydrogenase subunit E2, partial [Halobacteria archaeon]|nr:2-oxo acid dehydrogenase subunit E2 [Halobacteria archaeon]